MATVTVKPVAMAITAERFHRGLTRHGGSGVLESTNGTHESSDHHAIKPCAEIRAIGVGHALALGDFLH